MCPTRGPAHPAGSPSRSSARRRGRGSCRWLHGPPRRTRRNDRRSHEQESDAEPPSATTHRRPASVGGHEGPEGDHAGQDGHDQAEGATRQPAEPECRQRGHRERQRDAVHDAQAGQQDAAGVGSGTVRVSIEGEDNATCLQAQVGCGDAILRMAMTETQARENLRTAGPGHQRPPAVLSALSGSSAAGPQRAGEALGPEAGCDPATVFRTLTRLVETGLATVVSQAEAWTATPRRREPGGARAPHFVCSDCGSVSCLDVVATPSSRSRAAGAAGGGRNAPVRGRRPDCLA